MVTFGLVHGAYHGSWCWGKLIPELERRNHQVLTVDLPSEDPQAGELDGGHSAFLATPTILARILDELAADPGTRPSSLPPPSR